MPMFLRYAYFAAQVRTIDPISQTRSSQKALIPKPRSAIGLQQIQLRRMLRRPGIIFEIDRNDSVTVTHEKFAQHRQIKRVIFIWKVFEIPQCQREQARSRMQSTSVLGMRWLL